MNLEVVECEPELIIKRNDATTLSEIRCLDDAVGIEVVAEATSGRELLHVIAATHPDVVLTDLSMPDLNGATAARQMLAREPTLAVLVLTMHDATTNQCSPP